MKRKQFTAGIAVAVAAVLFVAVNLLGNRMLTTARIDLTENQLYTLSQGTRNILGDLDVPVTLRFYYSAGMGSDVPAIQNYARRVRELLQEYQRVSDGQVRVQEIDPVPFTAEEDRAVAYGLRGIPLGGESENFYFGLVATDATDQEAVIPFFQPNRQSFLEYDVTELIYQVAHPQRSRVGILTTLPMTGSAAPMASGSAPWTILEHIRQFFDVEMLRPDLTDVPDEVDVLMLVRPAGLPESAIDAVDGFVRSGGRALVFVDPYAEAAQGAETPGPDAPGARLLEAWGARMTADRVVTNLSHSIRVQMPSGDLVNYPAWFTVSAAGQNADDVVTANLGEVTFATPGSLQPTQDASDHFVPLIRSAPESMALNLEQRELLDNPQQLLGEYQPDGQYVLAARLAGAATEVGGPGRVIVVADTDLLRDQFWVQRRNMFGESAPVPTAANGRLVVNALDNLTGSNDLISVRNQGEFTRPFTRIEALRRQAEQRFREKELELTQQLEETRQQLLQLQTQGSEGEALLGERERREIERFREQMLVIRSDLREVQNALRQDIERLETRIKAVNIGLMAALVALVGAGLGVIRAWRRRKTV